MLLHVIRSVRFLAQHLVVSHLKVHKKTNRYTSPDICNELLAHTILRQIASNICGRMFTIMVDETTDNSTMEQCVLVLCWVDDKLQPHDDFIGLHDIPAANASPRCAKVSLNEC